MIPRIGRYWDGMGGIFAGMIRHDFNDCYLILSEDDLKRDMTYRVAVEWANKVHSDGRNDFRLPMPNEAALLYANLKDKFEDLWYWTCEPYHADKTCAWVQTFGYGRQADARMTDACRARAVRIEPL